jgi:zinc and cadmium transporter
MFAAMGCDPCRPAPSLTVSTLRWIIASGRAMSALALVGTVTIVLPTPLRERMLLPPVGLAAGSLLAGAFFHMPPEAVEALGNRLALYATLMAGFVVSFVLGRPKVPCRTSDDRQE